MPFKIGEIVKIKKEILFAEEDYVRKFSLCLIDKTTANNDRYNLKCADTGESLCYSSRNIVYFTDFELEYPSVIELANYRIKAQQQ